MNIRVRDCLTCIEKSLFWVKYMIIDIKKKRILKLALFSVLTAILFCFGIHAEYVEYGERTAPGGLIEDVSDFVQALGGESAAIISENGNILLVCDIKVESPLILNGGSYRLTGGGCEISSLFSGESIFKLENGAELILGSENDSSADSLSLKCEETQHESLISVGNECSVTLNSGVVLTGGAGTYGGALYSDGGVIIVSGGQISSFSAQYGGAVYLKSGRLKINGGIISDCSAEIGGAIYVDSGVLEISGGIIGEYTGINSSGGAVTIGAKNKAELYGGGIFINNGEFIFSGGYISGNTAECGGGLYAEENVSLSFSGAAFVNNEANLGGAIYNKGKVSSAYVKINDNAAERGVGIYNAVNLSFANGDINANTASYGGAVLNEGTFVLEYGSITGNSAEFGGGVFNDGEFFFRGGVIGHTAAVADTIGTAVFNRGYIYMAATAFVYEDSAIALIRTSDGLNKIIVGEFNGADIAAYIEVYDEAFDSDGNYIYKQKTNAGTLLIDGDSAENIASAASHFKVRDGKYTVGLSENGEILFYVKPQMVIAAVTGTVFLSVIIIIFVVLIKKVKKDNKKMENTKHG